MSHHKFKRLISNHPTKKKKLKNTFQLMLSFSVFSLTNFKNKNKFKAKDSLDFAKVSITIQIQLAIFIS